MKNKTSTSTSTSTFTNKTFITDYPNLLLSCMGYSKGNDTHNKESIELCIQYLPPYFNRLNVAELTGIPYTEVCKLTTEFNIKYGRRVYL